MPRCPRVAWKWIIAQPIMHASCHAPLSETSPLGTFSVSAWAVRVHCLVTGSPATRKSDRAVVDHSSQDTRRTSSYASTARPEPEPERLRFCVWSRYTAGTTPASRVCVPLLASTCYGVVQLVNLYVGPVSFFFLKELKQTYVDMNIRPRLVSKIFQNSLSHRIFRHIHKALNIDKNNN